MLSSYCTDGGGEAASFQPVFEWLAESHKVYALDLPGFG